MLDIKPVISLEPVAGKTILSGKSFSQKGSMRNSLRSIARLLRHNRLWEYSITHANNPEAVEWYRSEMEKLTGKQPVFIEEASPVLVAHTGPGVVCVSLMLE